MVKIFNPTSFVKKKGKFIFGHKTTTSLFIYLLRFSKTVIENCAIMAEKKDSRNKHVVVLAFPFASHPASALSVVRRIAKEAPHVTFSFFSTARSYGSLFPALDARTETRRIPGYDNIWGFDIPDGAPQNYDFGKNDVMEEIGFVLDTAKENFREGAKLAETIIGIRISCVMSDAFMWFSCEIAEEFKVPWIAIWSGGINCISLHIYTELIRQNLGMHGNFYS